MKWDDTKQARLDALRAAELAGTLNEAGRAELAELIDAVEAEERERLAPAFDRMQAGAGSRDGERATGCPGRATGATAGRWLATVARLTTAPSSRPGNIPTHHGRNAVGW